MFPLNMYIENKHKIVYKHGQQIQTKNNIININQKKIQNMEYVQIALKSLVKLAMDLDCNHVLVDVMELHIVAFHVKNNIGMYIFMTVNIINHKESHHNNNH